jgi:hypothetical protein
MIYTDGLVSLFAFGGICRRHLCWHTIQTDVRIPRPLPAPRGGIGGKLDDSWTQARHRRQLLTC